MRSLNGQDNLQREQKPQRNNILTSGQRFSVRLALATGATLAALMGVQTLALQEQSLYADTSNVTTSQIITTDAEGNELALVVNNSATVIEATVTAQPTEIVQPTAQPTTAVVVTTSSQPRPSTRSSR